jgi:class 3 adenylate cyclase/predicted ATPase
MRCTKCGTDNTADAKFCNQCATPLMRACPQCAHLNAPDAKFCAQCAAALASPAPATRSQGASWERSRGDSNVAERVRVQTDGELPSEGERKTVTALFADIKGSTELMEDLDPEAARAIIDPALNLMMDAVHRYDGYVVQSTGDGIFALFGAPVAHEDHPQRALYAALRMLEELRGYSAKVIADGGMPIEARIGAHSGEVVVRSIATGGGRVEYTPIGHTTNLAARMQAVAPTGSIAVSEQTRKFIEGYFALKPLGPTKVKGVSEPVNVYEVTGLGPLRTRLQRAVGRGLTKFVGRTREMDAIVAAAERAKAGHGQIVAAIAEPGVGKSRLFFEFKARAAAGWMVLETFSISPGKASAYLPVIDLLRNYFDITVADDERKRREKVTGRVLALDRSLEDTLPYLFSLLGIVEGDDPLPQMDGQIKKRRTLEAIKRIVLRESLNQPLMVIFEDLHWIDDETQELLNLLADSIGTAKFLLLVNYRPEYVHQWSSKRYYTQMRLEPLGLESAAEMLSALLGDGEDLLSLKRLIIERTEGTPFFMEEIVQALFEDGVLQRNGVVKLAKSLNAVKVPATVQAVLASRIDRLPAEARELLQTLAVLGREFPLGLVQRVTLKPHGESERLLAELQLAEFIYEQPAVGDIEYAFKHALTQDVAYNALLIERRKLLHERAGQALEAMFADQLDDHLDELAHHYSRSDNVGKAIEYLGRAGKQALQRPAYADAIGSLSAALNLLQKRPDDPTRFQQELLLQLALGPALIAVKGLAAPEVERSYTRARELCEILGEDPPELFPTLWGLWAVHLVRAELRRAAELAEQLLRRAQSAHEPVRLIYARMARGATSYFMGGFLAAREHFEIAISLYDPEHHRPLAFRYGGADAGVRCVSYAAWALWQLGYPDQALQRCDQALALAQTLAHPFGLAWAEVFVDVLRQLRGETRATQENAQNLIPLSTEHGLTDFLAFATILRGWAMAQLERNEEGITQIREGLAATRATGAEIVSPYFLCLLAEACMATGRLDEGLVALTESLAAADENENRFYEAETHRLKGELLLRRHGDGSGAEDSSAGARGELAPGALAIGANVSARRIRNESLRRADKASGPRGAPQIGNTYVAEAQTCFERAIAVARKQSARSLELRATTSLARLLAAQGRRDEARTMLADIYGWFTEGFDTPDLKAAKTLLAELS